MLYPRRLSLLIGIAVTILLTCAGFFLYEPMLIFIYPNIGMASLEQYFYGQVSTALAFSVLGFLITLYAWVQTRIQKADPEMAFLIPILTAFLAVAFGLLYYRYSLETITSGDAGPSFPVMLMADAIKVPYIPIFASFILALLSIYKLIKFVRKKWTLTKLRAE